jgi:hypothetical protein
MRAIHMISAASLALAPILPSAAADGLYATFQRASTHAGQTMGLSPRDAGRRGGEAAGAALVCYGLKITDRAAALRQQYEGDALAEFDAEAARILAAWQATKVCDNANGPNECKVSQQWSCLQAMREIGPAGSAVPGLVEPK